MTKLMLRATIGLTALAVAAPAFAQDISFWSWRQEDREQYEQIIAAFEEQHPDINVTFEPFEAQNYNTILSTALAGDSGPDVMMVRAHGAFETVAAGGYLMPLTEETVPGLGSLPEAALAAETLSSDGQVYAVPFASQTMLVIYNKDIFDELGIEEPSTWDDLMAVSQTIEDAGMFAFANGTATAWQNETIVSALGSSIIGKDFYNDLVAGETDFTDPRFVEALEAVQEASQYFPDGFVGLDYASSQQLFASGMAGMFAGGSFEIANFLGQNPDLNLGVFPAPVAEEGDEHLVGLFFDGGYAGNADTEHPEAVQTFLSFLTTPEFGNMFANELGNISPIPGVEFESELLQEVAELNENSIPYIMLVHFRYEEPSGSVLLQAEVQRMLAGETTPEAAAQAVTDGIATYYEPFQN
ncbi:extracellular solute-binding protein [Pelagibacterium xiamenense]|uniref:extracellular solute-binding protein n=1 Tax=Pelagibacterium xiamenense TaxID=2901140 RepID=UPI001E387CED|nr:extracellular solute-binding protein [Pelagibacterium xiamenense]MCD7061369.1 extracellular solute-binding protein [Pelagibacterium xiamenense]